MNILYIEDDIIDQMAFKRLTENNTKYSITIVSTKKEVEQLLLQKKFDLIVCDFFLGENTAFDIFPLFENQKIILLANEQEVNLPANNNIIMLTQKPISAKIFNSTFFHESELDLSYFNKLTDNDTEFQIELLETAIETLPTSINNLALAKEEQNFDNIKFEAHKMKSGARVVGIKIIPDLEFIEHNSIIENKEKIYNLIDDVITKSNQGIVLIQQKLIQLKQI